MTGRRVSRLGAELLVFAAAVSAIVVAAAAFVHASEGAIMLPLESGRRPAPPPIDRAAPARVETATFALG